MVDGLIQNLREVTEDKRAFHLERLVGFAIAIETGNQLLDGTLSRRAQMYAHSGRGMYHEVEREIMIDDGMTEERSIRTATDSCEGCIEESGKQWQPVGTIIPVGNHICLVHCLCFMEYRLKPGSHGVIPAGQGVT